MFKRLVLATMLACSSMAYAEDSAPQTITLSPEQCAQLGDETAYRILKAQGVEEAGEPSADAEVLAVMDELVRRYEADGGKLEEGNAVMAGFQMAIGCLQAEGETDIPVKH